MQFLFLLELIWPGCSQEEINSRFLLFLTDGVAYMLKVGKVLKETYPNLLHVTCINHGLNRVAEEVRSSFPLVDSFLASAKRIFKKAPSRVSVFKEICPELALPPEAVTTRWGSWLNVVEYYAKNYEKVKQVIEKLDASDSAAVTKAKEIMHQPKLLLDHSFLSANFTFLCAPLAELEQKDASLFNSLNILTTVENKVNSVKEAVEKKISAKLEAVISKNPNLETIRLISSTICGEQLADEDLSKIKLSPAQLASFKYAPITTVDAERSFSIHKSMLSDRRRCMTVEHLEMSIVSKYEL